VKKETSVKKAVGLWIDHRRAVIVFVTGTEEEMKHITSNVEQHHRQSGTSVPAHDILQREMTEHLKSYYEEVVSCIRHADSILIFGPGEAKGELKARLEKDNLSERIVGVETSDRMTDPQIVAKVRDHYRDQMAGTSSR
jgi:hypothetical protein